MSCALPFPIANCRRYLMAALCMVMLFTALLPSHSRALGMAAQPVETTWNLRAEPAGNDAAELDKVAGDVCGQCKLNMAAPSLESKHLIVAYSARTSFVHYAQHALLSCVPTLPTEPPRT